MSIANTSKVQSTQVQGSKNLTASQSETASSSLVADVRDSASLAREGIKSDRDIGSLLGADFNQQAGFAQIAALMSNLNEQTKSSKAADFVIKKSLETTTA